MDKTIQHHYRQYTNIDSRQHLRQQVDRAIQERARLIGDRIRDERFRAPASIR